MTVTGPIESAGKLDPRKHGACRTPRLAASLCCLWGMGAFADVILDDDFADRQPGWRDAIKGEADVDLQGTGRTGRSLHVHANGGTGYYTRQLDLAEVAGQTVTMTCWVKLRDVRQGDPVYLTAKLHISQIVDGKPKHHATRFVGTRDWRKETLTASIHPQASAVTLEMGIQGTSGEAWFDDLVVTDGRHAHQDLDITTAATTGRSDGLAGDGSGGFLDLGQTDLRGLPVGEQRLGGVRFIVPKPGAHNGLTCVVLRGRDTPARPLKTPKPVVFGDKARTVAFLQAAYAAAPRQGEACYSCRVLYEDGRTVTIPVRFGREIGPLLSPTDQPSWKACWTDPRPDAPPLGVGVYRWRNPHPETPIASLGFSTTGVGPAAAILAITAIRGEEPDVKE